MAKAPKRLRKSSIISCQLSDGRVVQFTNHTGVWIAEYSGFGLDWNVVRTRAKTIEPGDWIGLENEWAKVVAVTELADLINKALL